MKVKAEAWSEAAEDESLFLRELGLRDGTRQLRVWQSCKGDVGCVVWDAGLALAKYLEARAARESRWLRGLATLELGSGTGLVGLTTACLGANVTLTDLPQCIPLIERNIAANSEHLLGTTVARVLEWGVTYDVRFDLVLVADCVYYQESVRALVTTLCQVTHEKTEVLLSYESRLSELQQKVHRDFWTAAQEHFVTHEVPISQHDAEYSSPDIHIVSMRKK